MQNLSEEDYLGNPKVKKINTNKSTAGIQKTMASETIANIKHSPTPTQINISPDIKG